MSVHDLIVQKVLNFSSRGKILGVVAKLTAKSCRGGRGFRFLALALFCFLPSVNGAHSKLVTVPFRTAESMILVEARVNDNRVTLVLDTGANNTIVSPKAYGNLQFRLRSIHNNDTGPGLRGDTVLLRANVSLANRTWNSQPVYVMNVDELTRRFGTPVDGLLGQDLLREFHSVRINYQAHVVELEQ
jgi:aspartyl protease